MSKKYFAFLTKEDRDYVKKGFSDELRKTMIVFMDYYSRDFLAHKNNRWSNSNSIKDAVMYKDIESATAYIGNKFYIKDEETGNLVKNKEVPIKVQLCRISDDGFLIPADKSENLFARIFKNVLQKITRK